MLRFFQPDETYLGLSSNRLPDPIGIEPGRRAQRAAQRQVKASRKCFADLTITATSVLYVSGNKELMLAGATITAGQLIYKDTSDSDKAKLVDADSATAAAHSIYGVALTGGVSGQYIGVQTSGVITIGATTAVGIIYCASATAGGIFIGSPGSGLYTSIFGVGASTTTIAILSPIYNSGYVVA